VIKKIFLENNSSNKHKKITKSKNVYVIGGLIYLSCVFFLNLDLIIKILYFGIFVFGFMADKNIFKSASARLVYQIILLSLFLIFADLKIIETRVILLDNLISNNILNFIFTIFCILILINGSNFIDGVNLNLIGYYLIITIFLYFIYKNYNLDIDIQNLKVNFILLLIILILNCTGKIISGDSGAYLISMNFSLILINLANENPNISPFLIALLLWYPAFENLFSIIRKKNLSKSVLKPDFAHLHQLLYLTISKKVKSKLLSNNLSGLAINTYNAGIFTLAVNFVSNTQTLVILIIINIFIYIMCYLKFRSLVIKDKIIF
jgi:UDP-N-acetylmuramyl pentapeptide phosphotransferase/UDP-N-acetylglucosamine-1-phosphate transferase